MHLHTSITIQVTTNKKENIGQTWDARQPLHEGYTQALESAIRTLADEGGCFMTGEYVTVSAVDLPEASFELLRKGYVRRASNATGCTDELCPQARVDFSAVFTLAYLG